jgi:hypothetical protein
LYSTVGCSSKFYDKILILVDIQMMNEVQSWPYLFPASEDFLKPDQRGNVSGRLLVLDRYLGLIFPSLFLRFLFCNAECVSYLLYKHSCPNYVAIQV